MEAKGEARIPGPVARFREEYRTHEIGPRYRGWLHFGFTTIGSLAVLAFAVSRVSGAAPLEWLTVPVAFLFANFAEYLGHRGPMHHRRRPLRILFERHTKQHHQFFTHEAMAYESSRDFKMVLFPPAMLVFFLGGVAAPLAGLLFLVAGANVAWLFVAVAIAYFLTYEWLHFAYHLDERSFVGGSILFRSLRRHHQRHHDKALMGHWNFNITFPIADLVFGTVWSPAERAKVRAEGAGSP
jgi:hypothetical protein